MRQFLYLCLFGTALVNTSVYAASASWGGSSAPYVLPSNTGTAMVNQVAETMVNDAAFDLGPVVVESTYATAVGEPVKQVGSYFVDAFGNVTPGAGDLVSSASSAVSSAATTTATTVTSGASALGSQTLLNAGYPTLGSIVEGAATTTTTTVTSGASALGSQTLLNAGYSTVGSVVEGAGLGATRAIGELSADGLSAWGGVGTGWVPVNSVSAVAETGGFWSDVGNGLLSMDKRIADFFSSATDTGGWLTPSGIGDRLASAWNGAANAISNAFNGAWTAEVVTIAGKNLINVGAVAGEALTGAAADYAGNLFADGAGKLFEKTVEGGVEKLTEVTAEQAAANLVAKGASEEAAKKVVQDALNQGATAIAPDKATVFNVIQYAIVILQALEGTEQEDITKEVTVKAQELQDSQGSSTPSTIAEATTTPDASLAATSLTGAANAMIALLKNNPIYPALLSEESCLLSGTSAASGTASRDSTEDVRSTNNYIQCMQKKRLAFANTTALSAQIIAEGSNAISHEFYDRVSSLATAAKGTTGTLGSMSVVNDSERFPYFEMVRGSALSAIQLELKGAETLSELTGVMEEVKDAQ